MGSYQFIHRPCLTYEVAVVEQIPVEFATMLTFSFFNLVMDHTMNWIIIQALNPYILANSSVFLVLAALVPKLVVKQGYLRVKISVVHAHMHVCCNTPETICYTSEIHMAWNYSNYNTR